MFSSSSTASNGGSSAFHVLTPPFEKGGQGGFWEGYGMLRYAENLKAKARELRKALTESESALWSRLRAKRVFGVQFYRQKPIGQYIVDFFAPRAKLVIEVDGSQHMEEDHSKRDKQRDEYLTKLGLKVLRFDSRVALTETDAVMEIIYQTVTDRLNSEIPPVPPFPKGGTKEESSPKRREFNASDLGRSR